MRFPIAVVFRNELLQSGKDLEPCDSQEDLEIRSAQYRAQARTMRRFAVWIAIDRTGKEYEIARGEA